MKMDRRKLGIALANAGKTYAAIAKAGVSRTTLAEIKSGKRTNINLTTIGKLARALECSVEDIIE